MKDICQLTHADSRTHDDGYFVDQLARPRGHYGRAHDAVGAVSDINFYETIVFTISDRAVDILHHHRVALHWNGPPPRLPDVHADMRDFRIAISAPGNR